MRKHQLSIIYYPLSIIYYLMLSKVIISSLCFALFSVETRILFISKQSLRSDSPSFSVIDSESISNRSQYSVSAVSFKEMCNFEIKSARLTAYIAHSHLHRYLLHYEKSALKWPDLAFSRKDICTIWQFVLQRAMLYQAEHCHATLQSPQI